MLNDTTFSLSTRLSLLGQHFDRDPYATTRSVNFGVFGGILGLLATIPLTHQLSRSKRLAYYFFPWALSFGLSYAYFAEAPLAERRVRTDAVIVARQALGLPVSRSVQTLQDASESIISDRFVSRTPPELTTNPSIPYLPSIVMWPTLALGPAASTAAFVCAYPGIRAGPRALLAVPSAFITHTIPIAAVAAVAYCFVAPLATVAAMASHRLAKPLVEPAPRSPAPPPPTPVDSSTLSRRDRAAARRAPVTRPTMRLFPDDPLPSDALPRSNLQSSDVPFTIIIQALRYATTAREVRDTARAQFADRSNVPVPRLDPDEVDAYCGAVDAAVHNGTMLMRGWSKAWEWYTRGTGIEQALRARYATRDAEWRAMVNRAVEEDRKEDASQRRSSWRLW